MSIYPSVPMYVRIHIRVSLSYFQEGERSTPCGKGLGPKGGYGVWFGFDIHSEVACAAGKNVSSVDYVHETSSVWCSPHSTLFKMLIKML